MGWTPEIPGYMTRAGVADIGPKKGAIMILVTTAGKVGTEASRLLARRGVRFAFSSATRRR